MVFSSTINLFQLFYEEGCEDEDDEENIPEEPFYGTFRDASDCSDITNAIVERKILLEKETLNEAELKSIFSEIIISQRNTDSDTLPPTLSH